VRAALIVGLGVTGRAVAERLTARGVVVTVAEDRPTDEHRRLAEQWGVRLVERPDPAQLGQMVDGLDAVLPSPGVPDRHPVFEAAALASVPVISEFDLAQRWDDRPLVAVTGTDGKTTVTTMITQMLAAAGRASVLAGNTDVPLVVAIEDPDIEVFVVEASSFRLGHSCRFSPRVGAWLNWGPDHLDVHRDLVGYEQAKASIWSHLTDDAVAVANIDDPVVMTHAPAGARTFGTQGDYRVETGQLVGPDGGLLAVDDLARSLPHDVANALAAWACAEAAGVDGASVAQVLRSFAGLPHRVAEVAVVDGVRFVDDSKATVPHAVVAAVSSFDSVVLIAGGRNKGIDLASMADAAEHVRSVVAIGEAADEVARAFASHCPVVVAHDMDEAVTTARRLASPGDTVLLSPGCASFDWYRDYGARGDDFVRAVRALEDS